MKALVKYKKGIGNIEIRDVPEPDVSQGEIKIEVKAAGICGTDIHIYHDHYPYNVPVVLGHEFSGEIVEIGKGQVVENFKIGDRVMSEPTARVCNECYYCRNGIYNLCPSRQVYGITFNGGFTKYVTVRKESVHKLPENVSFTAGALTEPLACCVHALMEKIQVRASDVILILGPGPIGLLAALVVKAQGSLVAIAGTSSDKNRLDLAKKLGIDYCIEVQGNNLQEELKKINKDFNVDIVVEASGSSYAVQQAIKTIRKGGKIVQLGLSGKSVEVELDQIVLKEIQVIGSFAHTWNSFENALRLLGRGIVNTEVLISDKLKLTDWEQGFRKIENKEGIKIVLEPVD